MRGIVTGGAGFLGSHVADVLSECGHDVTVLDMNPTERHRSVVADLADIDALKSTLRGAEFVAHLAAVGDVYLAERMPELAASSNVVGTATLCKAAEAAGVNTLVYASTWEVYGRPIYQPIDESHPCEPEHPYAITKLAGERLALSAARMGSSFRAVALRLGTAFGTRMRPNSVFRIFAARAMAGQALTLQGGGVQSRQFTSARDVGHAFQAALAWPSADRTGVFNIVGDEEITIRQLAEAISARFPVDIALGEARKADVPPARVSNERALLVLGWRPRVSFGDGLNELLDDLQASRP